MAKTTKKTGKINVDMEGLKKLKEQRECAAQLLDHIRSIPLFSADWDAYGGAPMPADCRAALEQVADACVIDEDIEALIDWLEEQARGSSGK